MGLTAAQAKGALRVMMLLLNMSDVRIYGITEHGTTEYKDENPMINYELLFTTRYQLEYAKAIERRL